MKHKIFALLLTAALLLGLLPTATAAGTPTLQFDTTHVWIDLATSAYASVDVTVGGIATAYRLEVQSDVAGLAAHWVNAYMTDGRNTLRLRGSRIGSGELVFRIYSNQDALLLTQTLRIDVIDSTPRLTAEALSVDLTPGTVRSLALTAAGTLPTYELRCEARTDCVAAEIDGGALRLTAQKIGHGFVTVGLYAKAGGKKLAACAVLVNVNERQAASCPGGEACPSASFLDTPETGHWAHGGIDFALQAGLFNGTDARHFEPDGSMTRGMLVTVLWRLAGKPEAEGALPFADVDANAYYAEPIRWAAQNGVVNGVDAAHFEPDGRVTREQIATILFRYAEKHGYRTDARLNGLELFYDEGYVSQYAYEALRWATAEGLIGGSAENGRLLLDPGGSATRAQVATILMRFVQNCRAESA